MYFQSRHDKFIAGRSSRNTLFPNRYIPMHAKIGNMDREMHIADETFRGMTDTYTGIPDE